MIWGPFCFLGAILFFKILSIRTSMQNLDSVAQEMSELCSILWFGGHFVFQNFVKKWVSYAQFCDLAAILFLKFCQEMSELCSIFCFGGHFVFQFFVKIFSDCLYKFGHQLLVLCTCLKKQIIWICAPALSTLYLFITP